MANDQRWVFGIHPVLELLKASPADVLEILMVGGAERGSSKAVKEAAGRAGVPLRQVPPGWMDQIAGRQKHQGVMAHVHGFKILQVTHLFERTVSERDQGWVLILDGLTDPGNFGALLRTAEAVGVEHVIIPKDRSVGLTPTVAKASAGAVYHLKIYQATNLRRAIVTLKEQGFWMVGLDVQSPTRIYDRVFPDRLGIILGSEGKGIRPLILRECDFSVSIPMAGKLASLNVAVAGGVFLYELLRQKLTRPVMEH